MKKTRNYDIDLFKVYYALIIVGYHFFSRAGTFLTRGNSAVSYFLIVSGMFLFRSFDAGKNRVLMTPSRFFVHRFWRFFPAMLISYIFAFVIFRGIVAPIEYFGQFVDYIASDIWELLLVKMNGMNRNEVFFNSPAWTISSIFLVGCMFWCFLYVCPRAFLNLILPVSLIFAFGYYLHQEDRSHEIWNGFTTAGTFRAWMMMGLGYYAYLLSKHLGAVRFNKAGSAVLTAVEILGHLFVFWSVNRRASASYEWCNTLVYAITAAIALSGHSFISKLLAGFRPARYFADVSMSIYLVHRPIVRLCSWFYGVEEYPRHIPAFLALLAVLTVLHMILTKLFVKGSRGLVKWTQAKLMELPGEQL